MLLTIGLQKMEFPNEEAIFIKFNKSSFSMDQLLLSIATQKCCHHSSVQEENQTELNRRNSSVKPHC